ncbi:MAG: HAD family hydrolase [Kiritimatiellales bacterium]|nr:HAD family hydrolase [Kiritimatiellales bacterium]
MLFAFDFDGVIVDSLDHNISLMNRAANEQGLPGLFNRAKVGACDTMSWEFVARRCGVPENLFEPYSKCLFELLLSVPPETRLFEGIPGVLRSARALGRMVVVTSNFESLTHDVLTANGLDDVVERVIGAETSRCKTDKLRLASETFGVPLADTVKIGDCISDIMHAHEAGVRSIAVGWGFHSLEQLITARPDVVVETPGELHVLLREWAR